jgi:hypothetical protein
MIGRGNQDGIWESHMANFRHILDHVSALLENTNVESVIITADHGRAENILLIRSEAQSTA